MPPKANVALICGDGRDRLTLQCIKSLHEHTDLSLCDVTVLDNATVSPTKELLVELKRDWGFRLVRSDESLGGGAVTNKLLEGARLVEGEFLYHSATDFFYYPGWLDAMLVNFPVAEAMGVGLFGAYSHPYHQPDGPATKGVGGYSIQPRQMVGAGSWFMRWSTWDRFGPMNELHKGLWIGSEDSEVNFRLIAAGVGRATILPEVVVHTGRTASNGQPTLGWEHMPDIEGVLIE